MARHHPRTVIRRDHPRRNRIVRGLLLAVLAAVLVGAYGLGHRTGSISRVPLDDGNDAFRNRISELETRAEGHNAIELVVAVEHQQQVSSSLQAVDNILRIEEEPLDGDRVALRLLPNTGIDLLDHRVTKATTICHFSSVGRVKRK